MSTSALQVLENATAIARESFGSRFRAAYALGSLAHGGFSPTVSDLDLALVFAGPLEPGDAARVEGILQNEPLRAIPLADRLSIFWGSVESLRGDAAGGRFPAADRVDLLAHGRLLAGEDIRAGLPRPSQQELVVEGA